MDVKSRRKISRKNGRKSRGPKTRLGLSRSSQNARRHGLAVALSHDPSFGPAIDQLANAIAGENIDPVRHNIARQFAEAQLDLVRIRSTRTDVLADDSLRKINVTRKELKAISRSYRAKIRATNDFVEATFLMDECEHAILSVKSEPLSHEKGIGLIINKLNGLERYERRALSRRNKTLHSLSEYDEHKALGLPWP